ncbi:MAG: hypothetical protein ACYSWO_13425 [Planctomycetota bacterium]
MRPVVSIKVSMAFCHTSWYNYRMQYKFTDYFEKEVLRKRPYIKKEWCIRVLEEPLRVEQQEGNRFRFWGVVEQLEGKVLRVITLDDKVTVHNAFPDRRYKL